MSLDEIDDETLKDFKLKEIAFDEIPGGREVTVLGPVPKINIILRLP